MGATLVAKYFLSVLFPSWKLFDETGSQIFLQARILSAEKPDWFVVVPKINRSPWGLIINPNSNFIHSCNNMLTRLVTGLSTDSGIGQNNIENNFEFQVIKNVVNYYIKKSGQLKNEYQFRIVVDGDENVLLISKPYRVI